MSARRVWGVLLLGLLWTPVSAWAQSGTTGAIAGAVKDTTGAVLPGVTVEAASPALIERVRTVATDSQGQYKIVDLRPGTYTVTFTLPGFSTYKREGIELSTGFTATANAEMKVGALEETVTVTGASPIVDVQNARTQQVLKTETINALPVGSRSLIQAASLTLGAMPSTAGRNDVGGDKGEQSTGILLHGSRGDDGKANWDGMNTNIFFGNGGGVYRVYYFNSVAVQEVVVDTGGNSAETETGGANVNMVPKEGSNVFRGYATANFTSSSLSTTAISEGLMARGVTPQPSLKSIYDYGVGLGGPIRRDKLWFYSSNRWWASQNFGAGNYFDKSTNPYVYVPDLSRPAYTDTYFVDNGVRLTWQAASKHKITQEEHLEHGCLCWQTIGSGGLRSPDADADVVYGPQILSQTTWTYPATNRLLFLAGATFLRQEVSFVANTAVDANKFTGIGSPATHFQRPGTFSITDLATGYNWGALVGSTLNYALHDNTNNFNQKFSVSYITGSHAFKTGMQAIEGHYDVFGMQGGVPEVDYTFRGGAPVSLTEFGGPFQWYARISAVGLFAQDQWTLRRLTLNLGVRFDKFQAYTLAQDIPAGTFVAARSVSEVDCLPCFKDVTPRVGAAYDVFGNGKTAIKASFGRYLFGQGGGTAATFAPSLAIAQSVTRTWSDGNGNFIPDCTLTNPAANGECGAISNAAFGQPITNISIANDVRQGWGKREYDYQTSVQLQQELRPGIGIAVGYFHTWWGNQTVTVNTATAASDYTQYCITAPGDSRLGATSGQQICGFYDVNPNRFGQVNRVVTQASNYGMQGELYNGLDLALNARWGKGAMVAGGVTIGREVFDFCYANDRPDLTPESFPANYPRTTGFCKPTPSWWQGVGSQIKLQGIYPLPYGFQVSGTYKNLPGIPDSANLVLTNAQVTASLGRNLAACPAAGACTATVTSALIPIVGVPSATVFDDRLNETDLRFTKGVRFGRRRLEGIVDIYNVFNARPPQGITSTYGAAWLRPTAILGGRLFKFGAQVDW